MSSTVARGALGAVLVACGASPESRLPQASIAVPAATLADTDPLEPVVPRPCAALAHELHVERTDATRDEQALYVVEIEYAAIITTDHEVRRRMAEAFDALVRSVKDPFVADATEVPGDPSQKPSLSLTCNWFTPKSFELAGQNSWLARSAWASLECHSMVMPGAHPALGVHTVTLRLCDGRVERVELRALCATGVDCGARVREISIDHMRAKDISLGFTGDHGHDWEAMLAVADAPEFSLVPEGLRVDFGHALPHALKAAGSVVISTEELEGVLDAGVLAAWR